MISRIRAPKGLKWKIGPITSGCQCVSCAALARKSISVKLMQGANEIGYINLRPNYTKDNLYETHSWLHPDYRGKGIGTKLYARAIQYCLVNNYRVRSSGGSSSDAQRVWKSKSLRKYFYIRKTFSSKTYRSYGDDYAHWNAYEKR